MMRWPRPALRQALCCAVPLALLGLAGCVRFGAKPPGELISISSAATPPSGESVTAPAESALFVDLPASPRALATLRVAVRDGSNGWVYVKDALWVDTPARQFQTLLGQTITARNGTVVLNPGQYLARQGMLMRGELIDFQADANTHQAIVTYDASLLSVDGTTITRQRFTASAPIGTINDKTVAPALSKAANDVAAQVADWIKTLRQ